MDSALEIAEFIMQHPDFTFRLRGEANAIRITATLGSASVQRIVGKHDLEMARDNLLLFHLEVMAKELDKAAV